VIEQRISTAIDDGWRAYADGRLQDASDKFKIALSLDRNDLHAMLSLASLALRQGDLALATNYYEQVMSIDGQNSDALVGLAQIRSQADPVSWETRLSLAVERSPRHAGLWSALGSVVAQQNRWGEAVLAFRQASALDPQSPNHVYNMAVALEHAGRRNEALTAYQQAVAIAHQQPASFDVRVVQERIQLLEAVPRP